MIVHTHRFRLQPATDRFILRFNSCDKSFASLLIHATFNRQRDWAEFGRRDCDLYLIGCIRRCSPQRTQEFGPESGLIQSARNCRLRSLATEVSLIKEAAVDPVRSQMLGRCLIVTACLSYGRHLTHWADWSSLLMSWSKLIGRFAEP